MSRFIAREKELQTLEKQFNNADSSFVVLYGRRRVGKSTLVKEFQSHHPNTLYILSREAPIEVNLKLFQSKIGEYLGVGQLTLDWVDMFRTLGERIEGERLILAIDEFQYLAKDDRTFLSVFQEIWDEHLKEKNIMLILCGSYRRMMESQLLNENSPLYGRRTSQILLRPIPFSRYGEFVKGLDERARIESYSVTGGVPKYIEMFNTTDDLMENIQSNILDRDSYLYKEPEFILDKEITDVKGSFPVMAAIAAGNRKLEDIARHMCMRSTDITRILNNLREMDLVEREVPVTNKYPERSKKGLYTIKDRYFDFWFSYVYPNQDMLESGHTEYVLKRIDTTFFQEKVAQTYERLCRETVWDIDRIMERISPTRVGRYWGADSDETDIVLLDDINKLIMIGECKYSDKPKDTRVMKGLKERLSALSRLTGYEPVGMMIFNMSGFTDDMIDYSKDNDIILVEGLDRVV